MCGGGEYVHLIKQYQLSECLYAIYCNRVLSPSLSPSLRPSRSAEDVLRGDVGAGVEHQVVVCGRRVPDIADPVLGGAGGGGGGEGGIEWND